MTEHVYLSAACFHSHHSSCDVECSFCPAVCVCPCHAGDERIERAKRERQMVEDRETVEASEREILVRLVIRSLHRRVFG